MDLLNHQPPSIQTCSGRDDIVHDHRTYTSAIGTNPGHTGKATEVVIVGNHNTAMLDRQCTKMSIVYKVAAGAYRVKEGAHQRRVSRGWLDDHTR